MVKVKDGMKHCDGSDSFVWSVKVKGSSIVHIMDIEWSSQTVCGAGKRSYTIPVDHPITCKKCLKNNPKESQLIQSAIENEGVKV